MQVRDDGRCPLSSCRGTLCLVSHSLVQSLFLSFPAFTSLIPYLHFPFLPGKLTRFRF